MKRAGRPNIIRESPRDRDRLMREIDAGDDGAKPRPRERVRAHVALQVQQRLARDLA